MKEKTAEQKSKQKSGQNRLLRVKEVAELLGVSVSTVYAQRAGTERLTRIKTGRRLLRWSEAEVLALIEKQIEEAKVVPVQKSRRQPPVDLEAWRTPNRLTREEGKAILARYRR